MSRRCERSRSDLRSRIPRGRVQGRHTIAFDFTYDGPGPGKGGTGVLAVDGQEVARRQIPHTIPFVMTIDETLDIGSDTRTPVDERDYQVPFKFTGKIARVDVKLGHEQLVPAASASQPCSDQRRRLRWQASLRTLSAMTVAWCARSSLWSLI